MGGLQGVFALDEGEVFVVGDVLCVLDVKERLGETEVVDSVQQVRFALSVEADKAVDFIRKAEVGFADVFVVEDI